MGDGVKRSLYPWSWCTPAGVAIGFFLNGWRDSAERKKSNARRGASRLRLCWLRAKHFETGIMEVMGNRLAEWTKGQPLGIGGYIGVANPFAVYDGNTAGLRLFPQTDAALIVRSHSREESYRVDYCTRTEDFALSG